MADVYNPSDGLRNMTTFPTDPVDETAARNQFQSMFDQILAFHNTHLAENVQYTTTNDVNILALQTNKADKTEVDTLATVKANQTDLLVERARIDSFTALSAGSTTGDAELIDARVGADGVTYDNAGGAIRVQVSNLVDEINDLRTVTLLNGYDASDVTTGGMWHNSNGSFTASESWVAGNKYVKIKPNTDYSGWYYNGTIGASAGLMICWYDGNKKYISGQYAAGNIYHSPSNARYVRISVSTSTTNPIFTEGVVCEKYLPYGYEIAINNAITIPGMAEVNAEIDGLTADISSISPNNDVVCVRSGTQVQIKTNLANTDKIMAVNWIIGSSDNKGLDMDYCILAEPTTPDGAIATGTNYKYCGDDICPAFYNSSYRGGNHGQDGAFYVTQTSHGKTLADVGSTWIDANNRTYTLWWILDANRVGVVAETNDPAYPIDKTTPVSPLIHVSGATHMDNIVFTATASTQIRPNTNNHKVIIRNNLGKTLDADGMIKGEYIDIVEQYGIIDTTEMLKYLRNNVGLNTYESIYNDSIADEVLYQTTYRYFPSGCCVVSETITPLRAKIYVSTDGLVQAQSIGSDIYVPFTTYDSITNMGSTTVSFTSDKWRDAEFPPYKYYQFNVDNGFALGYCIDRGDGLPAVRKTSVADHAGSFYGPTQKNYPMYYNPTSPKPDLYGSSITGIAWRAPVIKSNNIAYTWYKIGNDYYMEIELFSVYDGSFELPEVFDGLRVTTLKASNTVNVLSDIVSAGSIYLRASGAGSLTLKLN